MIKSLLRLSLGLAMILAASAVLLLTDRARPRSEVATAAAAKIPSVALFQHISQPAIEEGARGVIAGLAASGYRDGETIRLRRFNAEGDAATSNTIARELVGGEYALIVTLSTPSLQAVAGANRDAKVPHVFGMVSDPVAAGVGIARDDAMRHPPYMVGLGTMQPVAEAFRMARRLNPKLAQVGVAWNPSEANSEACTKIARVTCKELGIELLEANVENSAAVSEAVASVIGRGAEAVWIGGDVTVLAALESVIGPARTADIPVFSNIPGCAAKGCLFDLGADYYQVGGKVGQLASAMLGGESPAAMPVLYEVPPEFWINRVAFEPLKAHWSIPSELEAKADVVVERKGPVRRRPRVEPAAVAVKAAALSRRWKLGLVSYTDATVVDEAREGLREGLKEAGLVDGRDFTIDYRSAQGDVATLNTIYDEMNGNDSDLILSLTTTALQTGLRKVDQKPLLFALVLDPFAAGAGKTATDHRPRVTGVYLDFPYAEVVRTIREILPAARRVGTLFTPGEVNSVVARQRFEQALAKEGLQLVSVPVNAATEVSDAALNLCQSRIDVFCQISDAQTNGSFPAIARAC
ncbi:MAG: ABC transporter substrate-binding protein, partial [Isosphaeraceae bacterium]|nr:ABC transporter substrate-binding protein [Isosphaeraceae bacterium]